mmetsp:Transcript_16085/g.48319  ORF Transcript_16085/g.48319 Transcript_16085/m.48319 type:complete len:276 (-) Transcript_16085:209-1036(-)
MHDDVDLAPTVVARHGDEGHCHGLRVFRAVVHDNVHVRAHELDAHGDHEGRQAGGRHHVLPPGALLLVLVLLLVLGLPLLVGEVAEAAVVAVVAPPLREEAATPAGALSVLRRARRRQGCALGVLGADKDILVLVARAVLSVVGRAEAVGDVAHVGLLLHLVAKQVPRRLRRRRRQAVPDGRGPLVARGAALVALARAARRSCHDRVVRGRVAAPVRVGDLSGFGLQVPPNVVGHRRRSRVHRPVVACRTLLWTVELDEGSVDGDSHAVGRRRNR